ncbi:1-(5-phosphoribosyl)-5-[(5-phosphoribosylamino)methylideneamino]imidazole-4-carboxamide isomerase [Nicoliella lavandulae]|uniref:1-(5-phosphoribosyl)-5-[(5-phosphoribosylamino)methylideneamino] imidazole-4-carboxamide isomerase n=1 Tax=Nicoliella lavandulae TaxID=3082954 RepID=A0ABU8SLT6_9LACO
MIYLAIDLLNGSSVRLYQGDFKQQTLINADPLVQARQMKAAGIQGLHLVDLNGAKDGNAINQQLVIEIASVMDGDAEIGGGIRDARTVSSYLSHGLSRVILGSVAITDPVFTSEMLAQYGGDRITIGIDGRNGKVATDGWLNQTNVSMETLIAKMIEKGAQRFIVTDTDTDGTLAGPNIELLSSLQRRFPEADIVASGGISQINDVARLQASGLQSVIIGKALASGAINLDQIMEVNNNAG